MLQCLTKISGFFRAKNKMPAELAFHSAIYPTSGLPEKLIEDLKGIFGKDIEIMVGY